MCRNSKRWLFVLIAVVWSGGVLLSADELSAWLSGAYKAHTMSAAALDSVANEWVQEDAPRYRLDYTDKRMLYRHSFEALYRVVDTRNRVTIPLGDAPVRDAVLSPNNRYVVYARGTNLYIFKLDYRTEVAITADAAFNGVADWLYEEEFDATRLFAFSPDSKQVAFIRLDESSVPSFTYQQMLTGAYPTTSSLSYPRAGMTNAKATLCIYDIYYKSIRTIDLPVDEDTYLPRLRWVGEQVLVEAVNRDQNEVTIYAVNPKSTVSWMLSRERCEQADMDFALFDQWQWLSDGRYVSLSEAEGYARAYLCSASGQVLRCLTPDAYDVTALYGVDEAKQWLYFQAAPTPMTRQLYAVSLTKGSPVAITTADGIHQATFSRDYRWMVDAFESYDTPMTYTRYALKGTKLSAPQVVMHNDSVRDAWRASGLPDKRFMTIVTERHDTLNAWMILPAGFDASKRYPVVIMQYSGPASQQVLHRWRRGFGHVLASQGYVVINADPRGTGARGRSWRQMTYMCLGQKEAEDQLSVARYAASLPYVDASRIAMVGWSYGGYQTIYTMEQQPLINDQPLIRCGIAVAPVTSWRWYDSAYTERYMRRPQVNEQGYNQADVTARAAQLQGRLLLIHGLADDNVHVQHTFCMAEALVQAGKPFDMHIYPDDNHFLRQRANAEHVHRLMLRFLEENL